MIFIFELLLLLFCYSWQSVLNLLQLHGKGTLQHRSGAHYDGEFEDNKYHGMGTYTFPDGYTYKGQFYKNRYQCSDFLLICVFVQI